MYIRIAPTETAFASEAVELTIKTSGAGNSDKKEGGCRSSIIGYGSIAIVAAAAVAVGAVMIARKKEN